MKDFRANWQIVTRYQPVRFWQEKFYVKQVLKSGFGDPPICTWIEQFKQLLMADRAGENVSEILVILSSSIFTYLRLLHKAQCCSFVPPRCLQHNTGRHLPEWDWCKFFFAALFRLHTEHCTRSSLQSHSIRHAQHLNLDLKDNCLNELRKFCTSILI